MNVILLEKIQGLGNLGDSVVVKPGHGRNYLIPKGKAVSATAANLAKFEARRAELEKLAEEAFNAAKTRADALANFVVSIAAKAGDEGKLFGSLGTIDLAKAITAQGVDVVKSEILLPNGPLRTIGEYEISIHLHTDITVPVKINVIPE